MHFGSGNTHAYVGQESDLLQYLLKVSSPLLLLLVRMQQVVQHADYCSHNSP